MDLCFELQAKFWSSNSFISAISKRLVCIKHLCHDKPYDKTYIPAAQCMYVLKSKLKENPTIEMLHMSIHII